MRRLAAIVLCALLIRMALIFVWYQSGNGDRISWDGGGYYALAKNLLNGKGFQWGGAPTARRPPLYPVFIASTLPFSPFPFGVYLAQAAVGAMSCLALFGLGQILFDRKTGLVAAALMAFDYISIRQTVSIMTETLFVFFLIISFYCLMRGQKEGKSRWFVLAGLFSGASLLTRDVLIFYYPCLALWLLWDRKVWKIRFYRVSTFILPLLLVIGPWIGRNSLLLGRPALITIGAASTFYLANNPGTTGGTTGGDWELGRDILPTQEDVRWPSVEAAPLEWERYIVFQALDFIRNHPLRFVKLTAKKIINTWRPYQTDSPLLARWATALTYLPVILLGLGAMLWNLRQRRDFFPIFALAAYIFLLHSILIAHMRYRYPAMPFFMVFAAWAVVKLWTKGKNREPLLTESRV